MSIVKAVKRGHIWFTLEEESQEKFETTKTGLLKDADVYTTESQQVGIVVQASIEIEKEGLLVGDRILLPPNAKMTKFKIKGEEYHLMPYSEVLSVL